MISKAELMIEFLLTERRVLVIGPDYDENVRLAEQLESMQHTVDIATTPKEVEGLILTNQYQIALINYLSNSHKSEVLKKIKKRGIRAITFSKSEQCPEGYDGVLPKPFDFQQLRRAVI